MDKYYRKSSLYSSDRFRRQIEWAAQADQENWDWVAQHLSIKWKVKKYIILMLMSYERRFQARLDLNPYGTYDF